MIRAPRIAADGVPFCSRDACPSYDGKRCEETGFRPDALCEPEAAAMAAELRTLRERDATWNRATRVDDPARVHERNVRLCSCDGADLPQIGDEIDACETCDGMVKALDDEPASAPQTPAPSAQWTSRPAQCQTTTDAHLLSDPNDPGGEP